MKIQGLQTFPVIGLAAAALLPAESHLALPYPDVADTRYASKSVARFMRGYFGAKTLKDVDGWLAFFHPYRAAIYDSTLGAAYPSRQVLEEELPKIAQAWPNNGTAYHQRVLGDMTSAVVVNLDSRELFGDELRMISAYDFRDGKVTRQCDYWDGRRNSVANNGFPDEDYPYDLGLESVGESAHIQMRKAATALSAALEKGQGDEAAALFTVDAVFEDVTTRTRIEGRLAISRYLNRAINKLAYGPGAVLRHVLGSATGGGYEWGRAGGPVRNGIIGLELDRQGAIGSYLGGIQPDRPRDHSTSLKDASILILGCGSVARTLQPYLTALGAKVSGVTRPDSIRNGIEVYDKSRLPDLLSRSDILIMILPGSAATNGALDAERSRMLPNYTWVINVGRGNSINQGALYDALEKARIGGAALDVFETEPLPTILKLWQAINCISPHAAEEDS
ncbi:hypothetical protein FDECE_2308 [Fusarium decemcellulare]|nr:hypothetical protein FDECE_2308 [Fusarium decemcellulare]